MNKSNTPVLTALALGALLVTGVLSYSSIGKAQSTPTLGAPEEALVQIGLQIAPVTLNMLGKDRTMVGYGSYLVNAVGGCNDCHTNPAYDVTGDPFKGQPKKVYAAGYLAGGQAFGPFTSRNITPDGTGQVAGGLANFKQIIRTGIDLDKQHPQIAPLLQVMPWPVFQNLADRDLEAIYQYLTSIPCVEGGPGKLPNRCLPAARTAAIASPKNATVVARELQLDGSKSTSVDGKALKYSWTIPQGKPSAGLLRGDTATPTVQFSNQRGAYTFELTVTDSTGQTSTDSVTINFN